MKKAKWLAAVFAAALSVGTGITVSTVSAETAFSYADIFQGDQNITSIEQNVDFPDYALDGNGVQVIGSVDGATFEYRQTIDLRNFDASENIIKLLVVSGSDYGYMSQFDVMLTDIYDETNVVTVRFVESKDAAQHSYASVSYDGRFLGRSNEAAREGYIWNGKYGTTLYYHSLHGANFTDMNIRPFSFTFDYAEKQIYTDSNGNTPLVLDLDDESMVGTGNAWGGFTTGEVKLSVKMSLTSVKQSGFIVSEIAGENIAGAFENAAASTPVIRLSVTEEMQNKMPYGAVGEEYPLPEMSVTDYLSPVSGTAIQVFDSAGTDVSSSVKEGIFIAEKADTYEVLYSAENEFGKKTEKTIHVTIKERSMPIIIAPESPLGTLEYNSYYTIPRFVASGGSGTLSVTETVEFAGKTVALDSSRRIKIDRAEPVKIIITAQGYSGQPYTKVFFVPFSDSVVCSVENVPKTVYVGDAVTFPEASVFTLSGSENVEYSVYAGETLLESDRAMTIEVDHLGGFTLKYVATDGVNTTEKEFWVNVKAPEVISDYFLSDTSLSATGNGVILRGEGDHSITTANPVAANGTILRFTMENADMDKLTVTLEDGANPNNTFSFDIARLDAEHATITARNASAEIDGSFTEPSKPFYLLIDGVNGVVNSSNGSRLVDLAGFSCKTMYVSLQFSGNRGESTLTLVQISNQVVNVNSFMNGDKKEPVVVLDREMNRITSATPGDTVFAPAAAVADVLDPLATITLKVTSPSGVVLYEGVPDRMRTFVAEEYGDYNVQYVATDRDGNTATNNYIYRVEDDISPLVTVKGTVPGSIDAGKTFKVPEISVEDDSETTVEIYIVSDFTRTAVRSGQMVSLPQPGEYRLVIWAADSCFNVTTVTYTIDVR